MPEISASFRIDQFMFVPGLHTLANIRTHAKNIDKLSDSEWSGVRVFQNYTLTNGLRKLLKEKMINTNLSSLLLPLQLDNLKAILSPNISKKVLGFETWMCFCIHTKCYKFHFYAKTCEENSRKTH